MSVWVSNAITTSGGLYTMLVPSVFDVVGVMATRRGSQICLVNKEVPRLNNLRLRRFAAQHAPPQSWYDEDMEGLY
jgi:hypothetical protein